MKTVNKEIQKLYPKMELIKGEGYFYFISEDIDIQQLYTTSVYTFLLNDLTLIDWIREAKEIDDKIIKVKKERNDDS